MQSSNSNGVIIISTLLFSLPIIIITSLLSKTPNISKSSVKKNNKTSITSSEFYTKMDKKKFEIIDSENEYNNNKYCKKVYIAVDKDKKFKIRFCEFTDDNTATNYFERSKATIKSEKNIYTVVSGTDSKEYSVFKLTDSKTYVYLSRINNTVIVAIGDKECKETIDEIISKLGY